MTSYTELQAAAYRNQSIAEIIAQLASIAQEAEAVAAWTKNTWEKDFCTQMAKAMRRGQFLSPKQLECFNRIARKSHRSAE